MIKIKTDLNKKTQKKSFMMFQNILISFSGDPLYVGFDLTIASFDSISEVSMVRFFPANFMLALTVFQK